MKKYILKNNDEVFCNGCFLRVTGDTLAFNRVVDEVYFDGLPVEFDANELPYVEYESEGLAQ